MNGIPNTTDEEQIALALISLEHFEETGLHITLDEVRAWAKEIKTNRNATLPASHL